MPARCKTCRWSIRARFRTLLRRNRDRQPADVVGAANRPPNVTAVGGSRKASDWDSTPEYRAECLKALRWNFDYVLIDCPSPAVSSEVTTLAPLVDGVSRRGQGRRKHVAVRFNTASK